MESDAIVSRKGKTSVQVKTVIGIGLIDMCYFAAISCIAPFFSKEAELKGVSTSVSGIVFIASPLVLVISSPFLGTAVLFCGTRRTFFVGILLLGFSNIIFGFLDQIESTTAFAVCCILCRAVAGIGSTALCTNVIFMAAAFPNEISKAVGLNEMFCGVGVCLGPTVGGILYDWGGFAAPFWSIGIFLLCLIPVTAYLLPHVDSDGKANEETSAEWWQIIKSPVVLLNLWIAFIFASGCTFLDPILEPHLRKRFEVSSTTVGGIFLAMAICFTVSSVVVGSICSYVKRTWIITMVGCLGSGLAIISLDPSLLFEDETQLWTKWLAVGLLGVFAGLGLVPAYGAMAEDAVHRGFADDGYTLGTLSGFWNSCYCFGDVAGPSFGAVVTQHIGFKSACTITAALLFATALSYLLYFTSSSTKRRSGYGAISSKDAVSSKEFPSADGSMKVLRSGSADLTCGLVPPPIHLSNQTWLK